MDFKRVIATECYSRDLSVKKGNIYFVNTVNIENTVKSACNKNDILIYLNLPMDHSLPVESTPQIDFENTWDEDVNETSRKGHVDYSKCNFTYLFNIWDYNNVDEDQHSSCSDNESGTETNENEADEVPPKREKEILVLLKMSWRHFYYISMKIW